MDTIVECLCVGAGGAIGAITRHLMGYLPLKHESGFPFITLLINIIGAFVIGLIVGFASKNADMDPRLILFLKVGICGGFTTFSTFSLESSQLLTSGKWGLGGLYIFASVLLCVAAVLGAQALVK